MDLSGAAWRTSSYSGGNGGQCVEVAALPGSPDGAQASWAVRDSKNPGDPVLAFSRGQWQRFTDQVKAGSAGLA